MLLSRALALVSAITPGLQAVGGAEGQASSRSSCSEEQVPAVRRRSLRPRGPAWSLRTSTHSAYTLPRKQASGIMGALHRGGEETADKVGQREVGQEPLLPGTTPVDPVRQGGAPPTRRTKHLVTIATALGVTKPSVRFQHSRPGTFREVWNHLEGEEPFSRPGSWQQLGERISVLLLVPGL